MTRFARTVSVGAVTVTVFVFGVLAADPGVRAAARTRLVMLDAEVFSGFFRRTYHRQRLPSTPAHVIPPGSYDWLGGQPFLPIAHALGPSLIAGPNTMETFRRGYALGFRVFEVDLALTSDDHLVCLHGSGERSLRNVTYAAFRASAQQEQVEPCEFAHLLAAADTMPDVKFVIDAKNRVLDVYAEIRRQAGVNTLKAFIPQIYAFEQVAEIRREPRFAGEIFTAYRSALTTSQVFSYAQAFGVRAITLSAERAAARSDPLPPGLAVFAHPVEAPDAAADLRRRGYRGVYTSSLAPHTYPVLYADWIEGCRSAHLAPCLKE